MVNERLRDLICYIPKFDKLKNYLLNFFYSQKSIENGIQSITCKTFT